MILAIAEREKETELANRYVQDRIDIAQRGIDERELKIEKLLDCYLDNQFSRDALNEKAAALNIEIQKLQAEIKHFETHLIEAPKLAINPYSVRTELEEIARNLDHITFDGKRAILDMLEVVASVDWLGRGKAEIVLSGLFPEWIIEAGDFADTSCRYR